MENVPVHTNASAPAARSNGSNHNGAPKKQPAHKYSKLKLALIGTGAAILLALLILLGWFVYRSSTAANIDTSKYQAVFFTNGQVYFGKLKSVNSGYMKLTDIYYLQAQSTENESENPQETSSKSSDVQLIKLGNEVHGPEDEMIISKDQILFFENLKGNGKVTDSIKQYQQSQKK
jgi:hypothetical protein